MGAWILLFLIGLFVFIFLHQAFFSKDKNIWWKIKGY